MTIWRTIVRATGSHLPGEAVPNAALTQFPAEVLPLIEAKTGVRLRHYAAPEQATSDLAAEAAAACLARSRVAATDIDALLLATSSPDQLIPATAAVVQHKAGLTRAFACDVNSVCSGALYALHLADGLIRSGMHSRVLVVAAETYSRLLNPQDLASFPYFGDGAGAVLLEAGPGQGPGLGACTLFTDGAGADVIMVPAGGSRLPGWRCENPTDFYFRMNGREVFRFATTKGSEAITACLAAEGISPDALDAVIVHQANINIIQEIANRTGIDRGKFFVNLDRCGNLAAASVLVALDEAIQSGAVGPGALVALAAFGGGLSWGAMTLRL